MNQNEPPFPAATARPPSPAKGAWAFAASFAVFGFVLGGSVVFCLGFQQAFPPPPSPGTGNCGLSALGGIIKMFVVAPVAALATSAAAGGVGAIVDCLRSKLVA